MKVFLIKICILNGHEGIVTHAEFSTDGKMVVSCSDDKTVRIWDTKRGSEIYALSGHKSIVIHAEFSVDGKMVVSCSYDKTVRIWDAESGTERYVLKGHESGATHAEFSTDGKRVISYSDDNTVRVWNAETGILEGIYHAKCRITDIKYLPNQKCILIAGVKFGIGRPIVQKIRANF